MGTEALRAKVAAFAKAAAGQVRSERELAKQAWRRVLQDPGAGLCLTGWWEQA